MMSFKFKKGAVVIYQASSGAVEVKLDRVGGTVFLTQQAVSRLFGVQKAAISKHLKNIFESKELIKQSTVSILETVKMEGGRSVKRKVEHYNLDLVLSIGYRVNSANATRFRQWATKTLKQHILVGYTLNKKRLAATESRLNELQETIVFLKEKAKYELLTGQGQEILSLLAGYSSTLTLLDWYAKKKLAFVRSRGWLNWCRIC